MANAFYIDAYMKNSKIHGDTYMKDGEIHTKGVYEYIEKNRIHIKENQMLLVGRALINFTIKDILICSSVNDDFVIGDILKLVDQSNC